MIATPFTAAYLLAWARAFAFTELVEAPIYRRLLGVSWPMALAASAITHPFVWFVFPRLAAALDVGYLPYAVFAELFAWLVEAWFFQRAARVPIARALLASLSANAASVLLALLSRALFDVP